MKVYGFCDAKCKVEVPSKLENDMEHSVIDKNIESLTDELTQLELNVSEYRNATDDTIAELTKRILALENS